MDINKTKIFVINLERRQDRLANITQELKYMGWEYEIFKAIDKNGHDGCTLSHCEIIKMAKDRNLESVLVIEDDCSFMPYAKDLCNEIGNKYQNLEYFIYNLSPTFDRPARISENHELLIDLTNLPEAQPYHRGIYATNCIMYNNKSYDKVLEVSKPENLNYIAIDDFIYKNIYQNYQTFAPILPIAPQMNGWSDVSQENSNNFYKQTYQWNSITPAKIPNEFTSYENNKLLKSLNIHRKFYYENKNNN